MGVVTSVTEHDCGGYCDECADELWNATPQKDKVFYMRMTSLYDRYMDLVGENPDGRGTVLFNEATQKLITAMECLQLDCGMDDK